MAGARLREIRTDVREIFLPLFMENGSSHLGYLQDTDRLAGLFDYRLTDYAALDGTCNLVAYSMAANDRGAAAAVRVSGGHGHRLRHRQRGQHVGQSRSQFLCAAVLVRP